MDFNKLPVELILLVFSYLQLCELLPIASVCKLWRQLTQAPSLFKKVTLRREDGIGTQKVLKFLEGKHGLLELHLSLRNDSSDILEYSARNCPQLQTISVSDAEISRAAVTSIADNCASLTELIFDECRFTGDNIECLSRLGKLRSLDLRDSTFDNDFSECLVQCLNECVSIKELNIVVFFRWKALPGNCLYRIFSSKSSSLQKLILDAYSLNEDVLQQLCPMMNRLLIFGLERAYNITQNDLKAICAMTNLVWLKIWNAPHISSSVWTDVLKSHKLINLRHLEICNIEAIENSHLKIIGDSFPFLLCLDISSCSNVNDTGIAWFMNSGRSPLRFFICRDLSLTGSCFSEIPNKLPHLVFIDVSDCYELDTSLVIDLRQLMPELVIINPYSPPINDAGKVRQERLLRTRKNQVNITVKDAKKMYGLD